MELEVKRALVHRQRRFFSGFAREGWAWQMRAMSSLLARNAIATTHSAINSLGKHGVSSLKKQP